MLITFDAKQVLCFEGHLRLQVSQQKTVTQVAWGERII
jgi:hypothetical protein